MSRPNPEGERQAAAAGDLFDVRVTHRAELPDLLAWYGTPERAFEAGDYTLLTRWPDVDPALLGTALILLGRPEEGLTLLEETGVKTPRDALHRAFALWCLDRTEEAVQALESLLKDHPDENGARNFLALLRRPEIPVLLCGSVSMQVAPYLQKTPGFAVTTTGFADYWDHPCTFEQTWPETALAEPPVFGLSIGPETFTAPPWLEDAPFATFAFILDYDVTPTSKAEQTRAYDCLLTYSSGEHFEVSRFHGRPTRTFAAFSYTPDISEKADQTQIEVHGRHDILFTGYAFDPLFYRKARFLFNLTRVDDDIDVLINQNDYRLSIGEYLGRLTAARLIPTFIRWSGTISTRAVEALHLGKGVLVQRNGFMPAMLNGGQADGLFEYGYDTLNQDLHRALAQPQDGEHYRARARHAFAAETSAARLLKFCAFNAVTHDFGKRPSRRGRRASCGMHFECETDAVGFHKQLIAYNVARSEAAAWIDAGAAAIYNHARGDHESVNAVFAEGLRRFPKVAALRLNYARFLYHNGDPESARVHLEHLTGPIDLEHDPLSHDILTGQVFHKHDFPYGLYQDQVVADVTAARAAGEAPNPAPTLAILRGAAFHYLSRIRADHGDLEGAVVAGEAGLVLFKENFNAAAHMVRLYAHRNDEASAKRLLTWFNVAVSGYPPYLHDLLAPALNALATLERQSDFTELTGVWRRFYGRVRHNFEFLPVDDDLLAVYARHAAWFETIGGHRLSQLAAVVQWAESEAVTAPPALDAEDLDRFCAWLQTRESTWIQDRLPMLIRAFQAARLPVDRLQLFAMERAVERRDWPAATHHASAYLDAKPAFPQRTKVYVTAVTVKDAGETERARELFHQLGAAGFDRPWLIHFHIAETQVTSAPNLAMAQLEQALQLFPDFIKAHKLLERLRADGM